MRRMAYTVVAVVVILGVLALFSRSDDDEDTRAVSTTRPATATATPSPAPATATPTPTPATATPTPAPATATPTPVPATATPTPAPVAAPPTPTPATATPTPAPATATPTAAPAATPPRTAPTLTPLASADRSLPGTFQQLAARVPAPGLSLTDAYDPVCPGSSVEPIVFAGTDSEGGNRFAVWVFWPYPDREAFGEEWSISSEGRAEPLLDGCEPPNGHVYFNRGLLMWFVGFYGSGVEPGSPATSPAEVRQHPVTRAFLGIPR